LTPWWWAQQCSKHVEECNKLIIKQDFVHQVGQLLRLYWDARSAKHLKKSCNTKLDWGVGTNLTQLYYGRDMYRIYHIKNNYMFRPFTLAIIRWSWPCSYSLCNKFYTYLYHHVVMLVHTVQSSLIINKRGWRTCTFDRRHPVVLHNMIK